MGTKREIRFDEGGTLQKPRRTPAGFLEVEAYFGRIGVYEYPDASVPGGIRREMRLPEEVFSPRSMAGYRGAPVTREHPPGLVTPENAMEHQRGVVMADAWQDGDKLAGRLIIHDAVLAAEVESRQRDGTSPGYFCDVEPAPAGTLVNGVEIHGYQRRIEPNHLAVCQYPRGGDEIRVRLDGLSARREDGKQSTAGHAPANTEDAMPDAVALKLKQLTIGGITGQAEEHLAQAFEVAQRQRTDAEAGTAAALTTARAETLKEKARADALEVDKTKLEAERVRLDGELKKATAPGAVDAAVSARLDVRDVARRVLGKDFKVDGVTNSALMLEVLKKRAPGFSLDALPADSRDSYLGLRFAEEKKRLDAEAKARADEGDAPLDEEPVNDGDPEEAMPGRQDSNETPLEPRRLPARTPRKDADPKDTYQNHLDTVGLLPSQRPTTGKR